MLAPGLGGYVVLIVAGLFFPIVAIIGYLALALLLIVPRGLRRHIAGGGGPPVGRERGNGP